jgi:pyrroline-5-carboxylate reductase
MERVTSPAGTTAAGLYALEPLMVEGAYEAVDAALERTNEMAEDKK